MAETKTFSMAEVAAHAEKDNIYLVVHDKVYDCSKFVEEHPYVIYPPGSQVPLGSIRRPDLPC